MFNTTIGMMTFSGSIVVCLYIIIYPILQRYSIRVQNFILKMAVFFYLVPISELKFCLWDMIEWFPFLSEYIVPFLERKRPLIEKFNFIMKFENGVIKFSGDLQGLFLTMICIGLVSLVILIMKLRKYAKLKNTVLNCSDDRLDSELEEQYMRLKEELQVHSDVKMRGCEYYNSSLVVGFFSPVIIFPTEMADLNSQKYIMKHELLHVKNRDLITRLLAMAVVVFHWFNPLAYCLFYELIIVSEMICDKGVLLGTLDSDRRKYSELIVELATVKTDTAVVSLANKFSIKRRILEMKKVRKRNIFVSGVLAVAIGLSTSIAALALYDPSQVLERDGDYDANTTIQFVNSKDNYYVEAESLPYDYFFTSQDGTIIPLDKEGPERVICAHTKTEIGGLTEHAKNNSTGSCTVTVYDVVRCSKCNKILEKTQVQKNTYNPCPH